MKRFVEGADRSQSTLFPERFDDYIAEDNPVRVIEVFIDEVDLDQLGFDGMQPEATGRPAYHPATLLKIYLYGYLNRIQSSRRLERETQRNVELIWLTGRLMPDFKTIADFRKTTARQSATSVANSSCCAASSICSPKRWLPSTGASSRRSTPRQELTDSKLKKRMERWRKASAYITQAAAEIAFERSVVAYHEASMRMQLQVRHTTLP